MQQKQKAIQKTQNRLKKLIKTGKEIGFAYSHLLVKDPVVEARARERWKHCRDCEKYGDHPVLGYKCCTICYCPISAVLRAEHKDKCELDKWEE